MSAQPETGSRVSKGLIYTLVGVVVLVLIGVFVILPQTGDDATLGGESLAATGIEPSPAPSGLPGETAGGAITPGTEPGPAPSEAPEPLGETFEVFSARDPFQQLVSDESSDVATVAGDPASTGGTTSGTPAVNTPPASTSADGTTVVVEDVFTEDGDERVLLTANGTAYTLGESDTFATNWRVEAIDDPCVTLLYGDQARLVCEGESVRK